MKIICAAKLHFSYISPHNQKEVDGMVGRHLKVHYNLYNLSVNIRLHVEKCC